MIMVEATAVSPEGRISPDDSGLWYDEHIPSFRRITDFIAAHGAVCGVQLAHAGRKGSTAAPWDGNHVLPVTERGWQTVAPSAVPFNAGDPAPREMSREDMQKVIRDFEEAAARSLQAGFRVIELHMAHGYLMHQFLSPLANHRTDEYGGSLENRMRFPLEIAAAVRKRWPSEFPLFARISATDWAGGENEIEDLRPHGSGEHASWDISQSVELCRCLKRIGVDLIDCSSGGTLASAKIPVGPGYQVRFSEIIRREASLPTAAVGMITDPVQAEAILVERQADAVFLAREFLRDAYWPVRAAKALRAQIDRPKQYGRA